MRTYVFDLETTDLKGDFGRLRVASFVELNSDGSIGKVQTRDILDFKGNNQAQRERQLCKWIYDRFEEADILIGHNVKAFDKNFLNARFARYRLPMLPFREYIDTYHVARYGLKGVLQSASLENVGAFFGISIKKDKPSKEDWADCNAMIPSGVKRIRRRCEIDVKMNALVFNELKPYWHVWKHAKR